MLKLRKDYRIGGKVKYYLQDEEIDQMQIPDDIRKCVVFIYCPTDSGEELWGTGFFVCEDMYECVGKKFTYIVTAKHVINDAKSESINGKISLRINLKDGTSDFISVNIDKWIHHPTDDVCVILLELSSSWDIICYPVESIVDEEFIKESKMDIGDEIFIAGLFSKHSGKTKNIPIIRVGNISAMPDEKIKVIDGEIDAYLIESRSFGGLSGSPVFVNLELERYLTSLKSKVKFKLHEECADHIFYLLGLIRGHWDWEDNGYDALSKEIDIEAINMGIAIVTPATKILEAVNLPELVEIKQKTIGNIIKSNLPAEDKNDR